ncbi:MBL fold metallo-hydrolase [Cognatilysobacter terrigena]|uniref:MBL fold metallo-hydrolase n=1 Tax=Cognatilysobacter terrigena TaxID=2488749 RepID=UPI001FECAAD5|nr:MBL fold metallo-hydrolase [Lysobacter terrigena]
MSNSDRSRAAQRTDGRFRNLDPERRAPATDRNVMWDFFFNKPKNTVPAAPIPVRALSRAELDAAPDRSLYRLGHSTLLLKLRGGWWITDPVFAKRASPVQWAGPRRFHVPPIALRDLPPLRGVLLSHDHYDHLDRAAVRRLAKTGVHFYMPIGVGDRLAAWGVPKQAIHEFDWWQGIGVDGLRLTATPAQHFSGRTLSDRNRTLWASWVIEDGDFRLFFSGDSGYFSGFRAIGERFGPFDVTCIETGAYNVNWPGVHMQPEETVQAHIDLRGRWLLPIHNGTFDLAMHAWYEPFERVHELAHARGVALTTPAFGERLQMDAPHAGAAWWRTVEGARPATSQLAPDAR